MKKQFLPAILFSLAVLFGVTQAVSADNDKDHKTKAVAVATASDDQYHIVFADAGFDLNTTAKVQLDEIGKILVADPKLKVQVVGYVDTANRGADTVLVTRRSEAVRKDLIDRLRIDAARITLASRSATDAMDMAAPDRHVLVIVTSGTR